MTHVGPGVVLQESATPFDYQVAPSESVTGRSHTDGFRMRTALRHQQFITGERELSDDSSDSITRIWANNHGERERALATAGRRRGDLGFIPRARFCDAHTIFMTDSRGARRRDVDVEERVGDARHRRR